MRPYVLLTPGETDDKITRHQFCIGGLFIDRFKAIVIVSALVVGLAGFVTLASLAIWKVPQWQVPSDVTNPRDRAELEDQFRRTMSQIVAGAFVLIGATATGIGVYYTARRVRATERTVEVAQEQLGTAQEGQITERFTRAIEQLGNQDSMAIRLGGIYALERIAKDSPKDHWQVMEVLTAYVREHSRWEGERDEKGVPVSDLDDEHRVPTDIQAILTVLGRRNGTVEQEDQRLDLQDTDLRNGDFRYANFQKANLMRSNLQGAFLVHSNLQTAYLHVANLRRVVLYNANLQGAVLQYANIQRAELGGANLQGAHLLGANLQSARLMNTNLQTASLFCASLQGAVVDGADLSDAKGLTQEQIDSAIIDENTTLPDYLKRGRLKPDR